MDIPAGIAMNAALTRQAIALEVVKKSADADKAIANMLEQSAANISALTSRGVNVNISA
jgi:transcriptional regulator